MKTITKTILITSLAFGLSACGKSENVEALEGVLATYETKVTECGSKKETALVDCLASVMEKSGLEYSAAVTKATPDDPEAVMELSNKYIEISGKAQAMLEKAF